MSIRCACLIAILFFPVATLSTLSCTPGTDAENSGPPPARIVAVEVDEVEFGTMRETVEGIGTLRALAQVDIRPEVAAIVEEIAFREGAHVSAGDLLFRLNDTKLQRQLNSQKAGLEVARSRLNLAVRTFDRVKLLRERGSATPEEFDESNAQVQGARAEVTRLEAEVELITEQIADTLIHAPFSGKIDQRLVDVGNFVTVGQVLTRLYRTDILEIEFSLPERFMGRISEGQTVETFVAAFPETPFEGKVTFISPAINEATRDFVVKSQILNEEGKLSPGAFGRARITVEVFENRAIIPEESLVSTRSGYMVFVIEGETAQSREVQIGLRKPGRVEIRHGLQAGDVVVRKGHLSLSNGSNVRVIEGSKTTPEQGH